MRAGSLCTGIGGLDLAAHAVYGCELAWYAEIEPAPAALLADLYPGVPNHRDLTAIDWHDVEPVDVLTAGYPCQPFSTAGRRQGADDDRHLWPYIADAVRVLRPRRVVLENVAGHLSLGFGNVLGDLAEAGFDAEWCVLRASDVGAPHQRARLFVVAADASRSGRDGREASDEPRMGRPDRLPAVGGEGEHQPEGSPRPTPDPGGERHGRRQDLGVVGRLDRPDEGRARERQRPRALTRDRGGSPPSDADGERLAGWQEHDREPSTGRLTERATRDDPDRLGVAPIEWGRYEPAIRRWERLTRPAPAPTEPGRDGIGQRLSPAFVEWMMGYPAGWTDGLTRTQALKALGNAVVPQQGAAAIRLLEDALALEVAA